MKKEDFIGKIQEIGTTEDDATRRSILAELQEEVVKDYDDKENLEKIKTSYEDRIQKLESANMDLFLRVGTKTETTQEKTGIDDKVEEKRKFEDLFDEKGRIK